MRSSLIAASLLCVAAIASAQAVPESAADAVARRDRELNALIARNDAAAAGAYYDAQFLLTTASGQAKARADVLGEIAQPALRLDVNETAQVAVRVHGATAVLTGVLHQRGSWQGQAFDVQVRVTDTWVRDGGAWTLLAGHASKL
jgi:ketosteroid isomerase-like protein